MSFRRHLAPLSLSLTLSFALAGTAVAQEDPATPTAGATAEAASGQADAAPTVEVPTPVAQSEGVQPAAGTEVTAVPDAAPAATVALTDAHGPAEPGDATRGAAKAAVCAACHGLDGNAADPQYPKLAGQQERYIARQLALFKTGERENAIMMGFAAPLTPQDMRDLGAHYATQVPVPGIADETPVAEAGGVPFYQLGERLFRGGDIDRGIPACLACHGPAGKGNPGPAYPLLSGQHARYTADMLTRYRDGAVYGEGPQAGIMAEVARYLTDPEIQALATYIEGLYAGETQALPVSGTQAAR